MMLIRDLHNRHFSTLRVSLTNVCNLSCLYCVDEPATKKKGKLGHSRSLSAPELAALVEQIHKSCNLKTIRLTGGEPLLYRELIPFIQKIRNLGIEDIRLTTNGYLLKEKALELLKAGISSINISLDALEPDIFQRLSGRRGLERVLQGIDEANRTGMSVKINALILRGINETQILPLFDFCKQRNIQIRFLELMRMGHLHTNDESLFFPEQEILDRIASAYSFQKIARPESGTAGLWETHDHFIFGIIANESSPFCSECNRLRIDSFGQMYGCLSSNIPIKLQPGEDQTRFEEKLQMAMSHKQSLRFSGSSLSMLEIGG